MTRILVRIAKVLDDDAWENPQSVGAGREVFWSGALKLRSERLRGSAPVPVRVDHIKDGSADIGHVTALSEVRDLEGRWVIAHCDVDRVPGWLHRDTPASMTFSNLGTRTPMPGGWTRHSGGMVNEVSLLSPGHEPYEPGAKVWHVVEDEPTISPPAAPRSSSDSGGRPAGEVTQHAAAVVYRHPVSARHAEEEREMRRRLDWLEKHTGRYDMGAVVAGMTRELNGPSIDDLARAFRLRAA